MTTSQPLEVSVTAGDTDYFSVSPLAKGALLRLGFNVQSGTAMTRLLITVIFVLGLSVPVYAKDISLEQRFTAALQAGGFTVRELGYTFWGRLRIVAVLDGMEREIIINPNTGEVLRDQTRPVAIARLDEKSDTTDVAAISSDGPTVSREGDTEMGAAGAVGDEGEVPLLTSPEVIEGTNE